MDKESIKSVAKRKLATKSNGGMVRSGEGVKWSGLCRARCVRGPVGPVSSLMASYVAVTLLVLVSLAPVSTEAFRYPQSSSSSSLNSAAVVANADQEPLTHLVTTTVLDPNRPQTAIFVNPKLSYEQVLGEQQSKQQAGGQKEAEQPMNPNEVFSNVALLEPVPDWEAIMDLDAEEVDKRAKWNSLQGGWGKRAANNWNKLSAAWGKRRAPNGVNGWNNLSGMWGKKRAKWNELSGMWGKRAWNDMAGGWGKKKRSSSPHWNKLRGMWGKRSALAALPESANAAQ